MAEGCHPPKLTRGRSPLDQFVRIKQVTADQKDFRHILHQVVPLKIAPLEHFVTHESVQGLDKQLVCPDNPMEGSLRQLVGTQGWLRSIPKLDTVTSNQG